MKKTLVILGLNNLLITIDRFAESVSRMPRTVMRVKPGAEDLIANLREKKDIDFCLISGLRKEYVDTFIDLTSSPDVFIDEADLIFTENSISDRIYDSIWHDIFNYRSKRVFDIEQYDKIILVDSVKKQKIDFLYLRAMLFFQKNNSELKKYKNKFFGYVYAKSPQKVEKKLCQMLKKESGIAWY